MLTLIDALDTLAVLGDHTEFSRAVQLVITHPALFAVDQVVSVFEANIRLLGGLISAHILASGAVGSVRGVDGYKGELLHMAVDLGDRLLPAFSTPTGLPYGSINLMHGVASNESVETCTAGVGTFLLEFGALSRLTGNMTYAAVADRAVTAIWSYRSKLDLVGAHINIITGQWTQQDAGIGSFVDSWYEYLLKAYILYGDERHLHIFRQSYGAAIRHLKRGPWYVEVNMMSGKVTWPHFSSLQAFWPGMQTLYGDVRMAMETQRAFMSIWRAHRVLPERYNLRTASVESRHPGYPLRPELVESLFYLDLATGDPEWKGYGIEMVDALERHTRVPCGYASISNASTMEREDIMPSFYLGETLKYAYLLFSGRGHWIHGDDFVFTTEGHVLPVAEEAWQHAGTEQSRRPPLQTPVGTEQGEVASADASCPVIFWDLVHSAALPVAGQDHAPQLVASCSIDEARYHSSGLTGVELFPRHPRAVAMDHVGQQENGGGSQTSQDITSVLSYMDPADWLALALLMLGGVVRASAS